MCNIDPEIFAIFKLTKLDKLFDIRKDRQHALVAFEGTNWFT
jgi:hypothetical protein